MIDGVWHAFDWKAVWRNIFDRDAILSSNPPKGFLHVSSNAWCLRTFWLIRPACKGFRVICSTNVGIAQWLLALTYDCETEFSFFARWYNLGVVAIFIFLWLPIGIVFTFLPLILGRKIFKHLGWYWVALLISPILLWITFWPLCAFRYCVWHLTRKNASVLLPDLTILKLVASFHYYSSSFRTMDEECKTFVPRK